MSKDHYTFRLGKRVEPPYNMFSKKSKYWNKLRHNSRILRWHNLGVKHITYKTELIYKKSSLDHQRALFLLLGDPRWILYQTRFKNVSKKLKEYTEGEMTFLERFMTVPSKWFPLTTLGKREVKANMIVIRNRDCYLATVEINKTQYYVDFDCMKPIGYRTPKRAFDSWFEKHEEFEQGKYSDNEVNDALFGVALDEIKEMRKRTLPKVKEWDTYY